eukprot:gene26176-biopygen14623
MLRETEAEGCDGSGGGLGGEQVGVATQSCSPLALRHYRQMSVVSDVNSTSYDDNRMVLLVNLCTCDASGITAVKSILVPPQSH